VQARAASPFCGVLDALGPAPLRPRVEPKILHPMSEPIETRFEKKLEAKLGPAVAKGEALMRTNIPIRLLAVLVFLVTALWWPCRLFHPQFKGWGFIETFCVIVMLVGPFANLALAAPLFVSGARSGWPHKNWVVAATLCALSPWVIVLSVGLIGHEPVYEY